MLLTKHTIKNFQLENQLFSQNKRTKQEEIISILFILSKKQPDEYKGKAKKLSIFFPALISK